MSKRRRRCPGSRCGRPIHKTQFSCADCWACLPHHLRLPVLATNGKPTSPSKNTAWTNAAEFLGRST